MPTQGWVVSNDPKNPNAAPAADGQWRVSDDPESTVSAPVDPSVQQEQIELSQAQQTPMGGVLSSVGRGIGNFAHFAGSAISSAASIPPTLYRNFTEAPRNPQEQALFSADKLAPNVSLGMSRTFVDPQTNLYQRSNQSAKDAKTPDDKIEAGVQKASALIPMAGPMAQGLYDRASGNRLGTGQPNAQPDPYGAMGDLIGQTYGPKVMGGIAGMFAEGAGKAGQFATTTPAARTLATTRALVPGTPGELLQSGLKPGAKFGTGTDELLQDSLPAVTAANPNLRGVSGFRQAADDATNQAYQPYRNLMAPYRSLNGAAGPVRPSSISGVPIADAQMNSIPPMDLFENRPTIRNSEFSIPDGDGGTMKMGAQQSSGGIVNATAQKAAPYRTNLSAPLVDALREDSNAKLNAFYNKAGGDQKAALSSPETARVKAVGDSSRSALYPFLEADNGLNPGHVQDLQTQYGKLSQVAEMANKREPIFDRHDPISLSQKIVAGHGNPISSVYNFAIQKMLKGATDSDALVNSAVDKFKNPDGTPMPAARGLFNAALNPPAAALSAAGQMTRSIFGPIRSTSPGAAALFGPAAQNEKPQLLFPPRQVKR